jgi:hypothetical protein
MSGCKIKGCFVTAATCVDVLAISRGAVAKVIALLHKHTHTSITLKLASNLLEELIERMFHRIAE